jgi:hypothetical protein
MEGNLDTAHISHLHQFDGIDFVSQDLMVTEPGEDWRLLGTDGDPVVQEAGGVAGA